jgi:hypothetical protein
MQEQNVFSLMAGELLMKNLLNYFANWPFANSDSLSAVLLMFAWSLFAGCLFVFVSLLFRATFLEATPPNVADDQNVFEVSKDALWTIFYVEYWRKYPRDLCSYAWMSALLAAISICFVVAGVWFLILLSSITVWLVWLFWLLIINMPKFVTWLFSAGFPWVYNGIVSLFSAHVVPTIAICVLALTVLIVCVPLISKSHAGVIARTYIKAKKRRLCPLIRVV